MSKEFLEYYERELTFLRYMGKEFAQTYPKVASRLLLESDRCEDPHVERLLQGFAFLAARVHLKVDDEFPEITRSLLDTLYPHFLRPVPSMTIAQIAVDPEQGPAAGVQVARGSTLNTPPIKGRACKFRTCYDTEVWPMRVLLAEWRTPDRLQPVIRDVSATGVIRLILKLGQSLRFDKLPIEKLRFHLKAEDTVANILYELLNNNLVQVMARNVTAKTSAALGRTEFSGNGEARRLSNAISPVGFRADESLLPFTRRSFEGYRLLHEYFVFPQKFLFFDVTGLGDLRRGEFGDTIELLFFVSRFQRPERQQAIELGMDASTFALGCTPAVNLFDHVAEPILLDQKRSEYPLIADVRRQASTEIFSIDEVVCTSAQSREVRKFEPFYAYRHTSQPGTDATFWHAMRRPSGIRDDDRTDMFLSVVDMSGEPIDPTGDTVTVRCTCTNYELPSRLQLGGSNDFELEGATAATNVTALRTPTPSLRPPVGKDAHWRLISHLSLNHLSLVEEGKEALQRILQLYNFSDSSYLRNQIGGIVSIESQRHYARLSSEHGVTSARGLRVQMQLNEEEFVGGGVFLFSSVLERFLAAYTSMNSFTQFVVSTQQRKEVMKEWPPRAGLSILT